jgi:hypothetical protein
MLSRAFRIGMWAAGGIASDEAADCYNRGKLVRELSKVAYMKLRAE